MKPTLSRIVVYPIKSLPGVGVDRARVLSGGALEHDREFALFSPEGTVLRGKETPRLHSIRADYDLRQGRVSLDAPGVGLGAFHVVDDRAAIERWFESVLGTPVTMRRNLETGFPDDLNAPGPTVISASTLDTITTWFPEIDREQAGRRFRANLEIDGVPSFWEDRLFGEADQVVKFQIGNVVLHGSNPCARCTVPPRHPETGDALAGFQRTFAERRQETLPLWATASRFDHYYRLSVNTRVPSTETGKEIQVGDPVEIVGV